MEDAARAALEAANDRKKQAEEKMSKMIEVITDKVGALHTQTAEIINSANRFYGQAEENNKMAEEVEDMINGDGKIIDFPQDVADSEKGRARAA